MGNAAIIVVVATALSAVLILANTRQISMEADHMQQQLQQDALARELAQTGHSLVLANMIDPNNGTARASAGAMGFGVDPVPYQGGDIELLDYRFDPATGVIEFWINGRYGDADHTIHSQYSVNPPFETTVMVDAPRLMLGTVPGTYLSGGPNEYPFLLGSSNLEHMNGVPELDGLINLEYDAAEIENQLRLADVGSPGHLTDIQVFPGGEDFSAHPPDINPHTDDGWLDEFYRATLDYMGNALPLGDGTAFYFPDDQEFNLTDPSPYRVDSTYSFGLLNRAVLQVQGNARIAAGTRVTGRGILLVEGDLDIEAGATLDWEGFVYLRPNLTLSTSDWDGNANIAGALLIYQDPKPPGGHIDVTTHRDLTGYWDDPTGLERNQPGIPIAGPWFVHRHKWDVAWNSHEPVSAERNIVMYDETQGHPHEQFLRFQETIDDLVADGDQPVYLRFTRSSEGGRDHAGLGTFSLSIEGEDDRHGTINSGFDGTASTQSLAFKPSDLVSFSLHLNSLRFLELMFDDDGDVNNDGPRRVSNSFERHGSFTVELYNEEFENLLQTTAIYQHVQYAENIEYEMELAELQEQIESGNFGQLLNLSENVSIIYDGISIQGALHDLLKLVQIHHVGTWRTHCGSNDFDCTASVPPVPAE